MRRLGRRPTAQTQPAAPRLRKTGTYFWFYSATQDHFHFQNAAFAHELRRFGIPFHYFAVSGGHNWALWRGQATNALLAAAERLHA